MIEEQLNLFKKPPEEKLVANMEKDRPAAMEEKKQPEKKEIRELIFALKAEVDTEISGKICLTEYIKKTNKKDAFESFKAYIFSKYGVRLRDDEIKVTETLTLEENEMRLNKIEASNDRYKY